jgi:putative glycerol-1-phosphate prenyltransferase
MNSVLQKILALKSSNKKGFALLIDPDKFSDNKIVALANEHEVDFLLVGGSLITQGSLEETIQTIKSKTKIPVIIFPGSSNHISNNADAILLLSLISGRNPDYLIGQHVQAAPMLKKSGIEILSTGYILIDGGNVTTVAYISNTLPIPANKPDVASATAMAGEMIGNKLIYLDAGSGAKNHIPANLIAAVKKSINVPLIVGGGIRDAETAKLIWNAGADIIVIGNAVEENVSLLSEVSMLKREINA